MLTIRFAYFYKTMQFVCAQGKVFIFKNHRDLKSEQKAIQIGSKGSDILGVFSIAIATSPPSPVHLVGLGICCIHTHTQKVCLSLCLPKRAIFRKIERCALYKQLYQVRT